MMRYEWCKGFSIFKCAFLGGKIGGLGRGCIAMGGRSLDHESLYNAIR